MNIWIDDQLFETDATTLTAILEDAEPTIAQTGRMVVEVHFDGEPLTPEQLEGHLNECSDQTFDAKDIHVITANPHELAIHTLEQVTEGLDAAKEAQQQAADLLASDQFLEASDPLKIALMHWTQTSQSVEYVSQFFEINLDDLDIDGQSAATIILTLRDHLSAIHQQLIDNDAIGLTDSLGFDLDTTVTQWKSLIESLLTLLRNDAPPTSA